MGGQYIVAHETETPGSYAGGTSIFGPLPFRGDSHLEMKKGAWELGLNNKKNM